MAGTDKHACLPIACLSAEQGWIHA